MKTYGLSGSFRIDDDMERCVEQFRAYPVGEEWWMCHEFTDDFARALRAERMGYALTRNVRVGCDEHETHDVFVRRSDPSWYSLPGVGRASNG